MNPLLFVILALLLLAFIVLLLLANKVKNDAITRLLRDEVPQRVTNTVRLNVVRAKVVRSPVLTIHGTAYIHTRHEDVH